VDSFLLAVTPHGQAVVENFAADAVRITRSWSGRQTGAMNFWWLALWNWLGTIPPMAKSSGGSTVWRGLSFPRPCRQATPFIWRRGRPVAMPRGGLPSIPGPLHCQVGREPRWKTLQGRDQDAEVLDRFFRMDLNQDGVLDQQEWERQAAVFRRAQNSLMAIKLSGSGELAGERRCVETHARRALCHDAGA